MWIRTFRHTFSQMSTTFCGNDPYFWNTAATFFFYLFSDSRRTLFLLKLGSFQFAVLKLAFTVLSVVLYTNGTFDLSDVSAEQRIASLSFSCFAVGH